MLKKMLKKLLPAHYVSKLVAIKNLRSFCERNCNLCEYRGNFLPFGRPPRVDAQCPNCMSLERHRLLWILLKENAEYLKGEILHFAAETIIKNEICKLTNSYTTADLYMPADLKINIECMTLEDNSYDTIICNHVLEHVNYKRAFNEIYRILKPNGVLICSSPIVEGWESTYENPSVVNESDREIHFGQKDHLRWFGSDFVSFGEFSGLVLEKVRYGSGQECVDYSLQRGEKIYVFSKK